RAGTGRQGRSVSAGGAARAGAAESARILPPGQTVAERAPQDDVASAGQPFLHLHQPPDQPKPVGFTPSDRMATRTGSRFAAANTSPIAAAAPIGPNCQAAAATSG